MSFKAFFSSLTQAEGTSQAPEETGNFLTVVFAGQSQHVASTGNGNLSRYSFEPGKFYWWNDSAGDLIQEVTTPVKIGANIRSFVDSNDGHPGFGFAHFWRTTVRGDNVCIIPCCRGGSSLTIESHAILSGGGNNNGCWHPNFSGNAGTEHYNNLLTSILGCVNANPEINQIDAIFWAQGYNDKEALELGITNPSEPNAITKADYKADLNLLINSVRTWVHTNGYGPANIPFIIAKTVHDQATIDDWNSGTSRDRFDALTWIQEAQQEVANEGTNIAFIAKPTDFPSTLPGPTFGAGGSPGDNLLRPDGLHWSIDAHDLEIGPLYANALKNLLGI